MTWLRRFRERDDGSATIEALFWFMSVVTVFGLMIDAAAIYHGQARVLQAVQDGNRLASLGRFQTGAEVAGYITAQISAITPNAEVTSAIADSVVSSRVVFPAGDMRLMGLFSVLNELEVGVSANHLIEDWTSS